ncbi:MAG: recombinase family protein [Thermoplasmata archaeon]|nr:MAG: recombinase family protein [Thermoplasmata archaeon]
MIAKERQSAHDDLSINYRCERCWSNIDINLYPKSEYICEDKKGFVILCDRCKNEAPCGASCEYFEDIFLAFASPKELIQHFNAKDEAEAIKIWCEENGIEDTAFEIKSEEEIQVQEKNEGEITESPFGYSLEYGKLFVIEEEAEIVRDIFNTYLDGKTMEWIARNLDYINDLSQGQVREILKDPIYAGYKFKGVDIVLGEHETIIDKDTFNSVQKRIVRNIRNPKYVYKPLVLE